MTKKQTWLRKRISEKVGKPGFETQRLLLRLTEQFSTRISERGIKRAELARAMGVDRSMVTRVLSGALENIEVKTLVSMASALGCRVTFGLQDLREIRVGVTMRVSSSVALTVCNVREDLTFSEGRRYPTDFGFFSSTGTDADLPLRDAISYIESMLTKGKSAKEGQCVSPAA